MISIELSGRLGNHLWQYAVCRTVAEKRGFEFHIPRDWAGRDLFDCSLGVESDETRSQWPRINPWNNRQIYDPKIFEIEDYTRLLGWFQAVPFLINNQENIRSWFQLRKPNHALLNELELGDDVCVVNFRGGDYKKFQRVFLPSRYYHDAMNAVRSQHPGVRFLVITDDVEEASRYFPGCRVHHFSVADDFFVVQRASYVIIANSTFSWWAAWLNRHRKKVIAPKYWFRHNTSNGWWLPCDAITPGFEYMDREGVLSSADQCLAELTPDNYAIHDETARPTPPRKPRA